MAVATHALQQTKNTTQQWRHAGRAALSCLLACYGAHNLDKHSVTRQVCTHLLCICTPVTEHALL